jgi:phage repressor protein C with HTH and peptisase S24 domain
MTVQNAPMAKRRASDEVKSEQAERLLEAREARGFSDAKAAATFFGWNYTTYSQHERDERGLKDDAVERYSKAYRVTPAWLKFGHGSRDVGNEVIVMGRIGAGAEITPDSEQVGPDGLYEIESSVPLADGMIGFEVVGDSMWPRYSDGDVLVVPRDGTPIDTIADGDEAAVKTSEGKRLVKRLRREGGKWTLESHNADPIRGQTLEWVSEVAQVIRRRQWRRLNGKIAARQKG